MAAYHCSLFFSGPIISNVVSFGEGVVAALASVSLRAKVQTLFGFMRLNYAKDWDDFTAAVTEIDGVGLNVVMATRSGDIGYATSGAPACDHCAAKTDVFTNCPLWQNLSRVGRAMRDK